MITPKRAGSSKYALSSDQNSIQRKRSGVSNYHEDSDSFARTKADLIAFEVQAERKLGKCGQRRRYLSKWFAYCFTEQWASGISAQLKILLYVFTSALIICTLVLLIGRSFDSQNGYVPDPPYCSNGTVGAGYIDELGEDCRLLDQEVLIGSILQALWDAWTYMGDPGTHAGEETWPRRLGALIVTMIGIFFMATVIGFVSNVMITSMEDLRTGKSSVVEIDHTLLLGWSSSTPSLICEIVEANSSQEKENGYRGVIVILAKTELGTDQKKRKEQIEGMVRHTLEGEYRKNKYPDAPYRGTKVVVRIGDYTTQAELENVAVDKAKAIVIQAPVGNADRADSMTLRTVLSLKALQIKNAFKIQATMIAEVRDVDNQLLIQTVGENDILTIVSHDIIGRIMIKSARTPGLADVYEHLLGFTGAEFYMKCHDEECPDVVGMEFGDLYKCYEQIDSRNGKNLGAGGAIPFGVHRVHIEKNSDRHHAQQQVSSQAASQDIVSTKPTLDYFLNPPSSLIIKEGDEIVVLAEDDNTYILNPVKVRKAKQERVALTQKNGREIPDWVKMDDVRKEKILMCGWRRDVDDIIQLLNDLTGQGSELHVLSDLSVADRIEKLAQGGLDVTDEDVAWKDDTNGSETWGDHPRDNYVLLWCTECGSHFINQTKQACARCITKIPNLRLIQWEGNPANRRGIKQLNRNLATFWENDADVKMVPPTSAHNTQSAVRNVYRTEHKIGKIQAHQPLIRRTSSKRAELDRKHALKNFDSMLIMAEERLEMDPMHSDSNVVATLLLVKDFLNFGNGQPVSSSTIWGDELSNPPITFEIVDPRTQQILLTNEAITTVATGAQKGMQDSYFIISTHIVAKYLAMVAERKEIHGVLKELLGQRGSETSLIDMKKLVTMNPIPRMTFFAVQEECRKKETICLGYVQKVTNLVTQKFIHYYSGNDGGKGSSKSIPLPKRDMETELIFWNGESMNEDGERELTETKLIVIKGRHHDVATLEHFGFKDLRRFSYLTHDQSRTMSSHGSPVPSSNGSPQSSFGMSPDPIRLSAINETPKSQKEAPSQMVEMKREAPMAMGNQESSKITETLNVNRKQSVGML